MGMEKIRAAKITRKVNRNKTKKDLKKYQAKALALGAKTAEIIPASMVVVDERVRLKCRVPRCHLYGESANCPPRTPSPTEMRVVLKKYSYAVLFKIEVEPKEDFIDDEKWHTGHMKHQQKIHEIVSALEALAFNDGYYFATGFAAGGCKTALCGGQYCQVLDSGRCRFPLQSRPSMEGVGIDVFNLVTKVGWPVYPVAVRGVEPDSIHCAISVGIVFIV
jgi:predicted metal-binding protein